MKQKDIALIIVIVVVGAVVALFVSKAIFVTPKNRQQEVDVVQSITDTFQTPDKAYFNKNAFNPTQSINVGQNANPNPFSSTGQ